MSEYDRLLKQRDAMERRQAAKLLHETALLRIESLMDAKAGTDEAQELDLLTSLVQFYERNGVPDARAQGRPGMKAKKPGVNAAAWFYAQPGFHALEGVGRDCGPSDDKRGDPTGQQTVMSGAPDEKPDEAVTTVTGGERPAQKPTRVQAQSSGSLVPEAQSGGATGQVNAGQLGVTAGETALNEHTAGCTNCFKLPDGTPVRCSEGLRLKAYAQVAVGLDAGPIQHKFKKHPTGRDFCTRSVLVSRAVYQKGLTLPADRRYCGHPAFLHVGSKR